MITVLWVQQYDISVVLLWWVRTASCRRACIKIKMLLLSIIFFHWVYLCVMCVYTCTRALPCMKYSSIFWACSLYYTNLKYEKWHTLVSFFKTSNSFIYFTSWEPFLLPSLLSFSPLCLCLSSVSIPQIHSSSFCSERVRVPRVSTKVQHITLR